jgi:hypothetical protein
VCVVCLSVEFAVCVCVWVCVCVELDLCVWSGGKMKALSAPMFPKCHPHY